MTFCRAGRAQWLWSARFVDGPALGPPPHAPTAPASTPAKTTPPLPPYRDAVQTTLAVGYASPTLHQILSGPVAVEQTNLLAGADPRLLEGEGTVRVLVSNSRLAELREAADHLLHYPYGCVEQTSSSLLPWLILRDFQQVLPLGKTPAEIEAAIEFGVNRLLSMQTASGGLGYWPGQHEPMPWASAYGGMTLALAKRSGHPVPPESLSRLVKYLDEALRVSASLGEQGDVPTDCLALYTLALAGQGQPSYHELFFQKRDRSSEEDRALLALAVLETGAGRPMAEELLKTSQEPPPRTDDFFGCAARGTAIRLLAWCRLRPEADVVEQLVSQLLGERGQGHWLTTQGNAWALMALTEYATKVGSTQAATGSLAWGGDNVPFHLPNLASTFDQEFVLTPELARQPLLLSNPVRVPLFTQVKLAAQARGKLQPRQDNGYAVTRAYAKLDDDGRAGPPDALQVGDRILVTLRFEVRHNAHYLAIDDPLPALCEAVNPEFATQQLPSAARAAGAWYSDYRELRADRALFFRDYLFPGQYTIRYLARVRAAGTATAPATKVEEMYHPDRYGLSGSQVLESAPMP